MENDSNIQQWRDEVIKGTTILGYEEWVTSDEYRVRQWTGSADAVVEPETSPWIENDSGVPFNFGNTPRVFHGFAVSGTEVQRDDTLEIYESDLHAAQALAELMSGIMGRPFTVWYHGA